MVNSLKYKPNLLASLGPGKNEFYGFVILKSVNTNLSSHSEWRTHNGNVWEEVLMNAR